MNKIFTARFKLILYFYKDRNLRFDIFDDYDFKGNSLKDQLLTSVVPLNLDNEINTFINRINEDLPEKLKDLGKMYKSVHPIISHPAKIEKNDITKHFLKKFLGEKYKKFIHNSNLSLDWQSLPLTTNNQELSKPYNEYMRQKIDYFYENYINKSLYNLIENGLVAEYDITDSVFGDISYTISVNKIGYSINFNLNLDKLKEIDEDLCYIMENSIVDFYIDFYGDIDENTKLKQKTFKNNRNIIIGEYYGPSTISECKNIIEKDAAIEENIHMRRFLGVVTKVNYSISAGDIPQCTIVCESVSTYLSRLNIVKDQALITFFENYPYSVTLPGLTIFQDYFNNLTFDEIFEKILLSVLSADRFASFDNKLLEDLLTDNRLLEINGLLFINEDAEINNKKVFGKKGLSFYKRIQNVKKDIINSAFITTFLYFKVKEKFKFEILNFIEKKLNENIGKVNIDKEQYNRLKRYVEGCDIVAYQEGDSYTIRTYALQVRNAFTIFSNVWATGEEILSNIFETTFIYVFEEEPGTLVLRFPRLNLIFDDETFIINKEDIINMSWSRQDFDLYSRQEYAPLLPLGSELPFVWPFEDPQVLFKYGPRIPPKNTNPNASLFHANYITMFSAIALMWKNASTRNLDITVVNNGRRYFLGRTYFIPDPDFFNSSNYGWVGLLHTIEYNYSIHSVPTINLRFSFARRTNLLDLSMIQDDFSNLA